MENDIFIKMQEACNTEFQQEKNRDYKNLERDDMDRDGLKNIILKDIELSKCLMILAIKKYTWRNELIVNFGISRHKADKFKDLMTDLGYIMHKLIWEIPDDIAYYTMRTQANMVDQAQMLALTPAGEEWSKQAMDYIAKESNKNQTLRFALTYVLERTKDFKKKYKEIQELEYERTERFVTHHFKNGQKVVEKRKTLLGKQKDQEMKIAKAEIKLLFSKPEMRKALLNKVGIEEPLLLEDQSNINQLIEISNKIELNHNQALAILGEKTISEELKHAMKHGPTVTYNGQLNHLSSQEIEKVSMGVTDEEYKEEIKKGYIGATDPQELHDLNKQWTGLTATGYHDEEDQIQHEQQSDIFDVLGIDK